MKLYVGNLPLDMTEEQLKDVFSEHGRVIAFNIVFNYDTNQSKGFGFVEFEDKNSALAAMEALNGIEMYGNKLKVSEAKPKKKQNMRGSGFRARGKKQGQRRGGGRDRKRNKGEREFGENRRPGISDHFN